MMKEGHIVKMSVEMSRPVNYFFTFREQEEEEAGKGIPLTPLLGKKIVLEFTGKGQCTACHRPIKKTFNEGFCFPCFQKLAVCDLCVLKPEICHFARGTCREPQWGQTYCQIPHYVYLTNSSEIKVGLTRTDQIPTRWIDQGAIAGLAVFKVLTRHQAGVLEVLLKDFYTDKTNWQKMLKNQVEAFDLAEIRPGFLDRCEDHLEEFISRFGEEALEILPEATPLHIEFPVLQYPEKITSLSFLKTPKIEGTLLGIKGQYLILDTGVLNIRKHTGLFVRFTVNEEPS